MMVNVCPQDDIACGRHTLSPVLSHRTLEREEDRQEETKVFQKNWVKTKMGWHSLNSIDDMNTSIMCIHFTYIFSHFTPRSRKVDVILLSTHWWKGQQHPSPTFHLACIFSLSQLKKNQFLLTQICGQQLRNPLYRGVCPSQLTDHHRIVGKAMLRWAQANSPTLHLPFLVTTTQLQLFNRQPMRWFLLTLWSSQFSYSSSSFSVHFNGWYRILNN